MQPEHAQETASTPSHSDSERPDSELPDFEQVQRPEMHLALLNVPHSIESPIPMRRSPRFSSPMHIPPNLLDDSSDTGGLGEGISSGSRPGTPDNDNLAQDEPSSVLASRIMRAHDNPSPPPQSPENTFLHPKLMIDNSESSLSPTPDIPEDPSASDEPSDSISAAQPTMNLQPPAIEQLPMDIDVSISSGSPGRIHVDQKDIAKDNLMEVDVQDSEGQIGTSMEYANMDPRSPSLDNLEEKAVADSLILDEPPNLELEARTQELTLDPSVPDSADPQPANTAAVEEEVQVTPLRRSSRPRRSVYNPSPLREALVSSSSTSPHLPAADKDIVMEEPRHSSPKRKGRKSGHQKMESLSPHSLGVLASLSGEPSEPSLPAPPAVDLLNKDEPTTPEPPEFRWPEIPPNPSSHPISPIRFPSPKRQTRPGSPNKYQLHLPNAGSSSPARRILIADAVAQGQLSPHKAAQFSASRPVGDSKTPSLKIPQNDTPARRIPNSSLTNSPTKGGKLTGTPLRMPLFERSRSVEPKPSGVDPVRLKPRSGSVEPISFPKPKKVPDSNKPTTRLPFPIIPENDEESASAKSDVHQSAPPPPKPSRIPQSTLKQATSKIPRRTTKPYARPTASTTAKEAASPVKRTSPTKAVLPKPALKSKQDLTASTSAGTHKPPTATTTSTLKRKRPEKPLSKPAVIIPVMRQVPSPVKPPTTARVVNSPIKKLGMVNLRMVEVKPPEPPLERKTIAKIGEDEILPESPVAEHEAGPSVPSTSVRAEEDMAIQPESEEPVAGPSSSNIDMLIPPVATESPPDPIQEPDPETFGLRRTSRVRKPVAGINPPPPTRRTNPDAQVKRKKQPVIPETGPFSGMTAGILRQLTSTNTTKNQRYMTAMLETAIIRRDGPRPESPGIRAKTISQKEQEEKDREKIARAARRANRDKRRSGQDEDLEMDDEDAEAWEHLNSSPSVRHRRGAGEEEDYVTPKIKKLRLDENVGGDDDSDDEPMGMKKRVKWDQGLFTEVFMDEVEPRKRQGHSSFVIAKGCLAPTAKALELDNLGNLPNAESPLKNLVQENVVVQKFVYDSDLPDPAPPPPPPATKNTRKKKSS